MGEEDSQSEPSAGLGSTSEDSPFIQSPVAGDQAKRYVVHRVRAHLHS